MSVIEHINSSQGIHNNVQDPIVGRTVDTKSLKTVIFPGIPNQKNVVIWASLYWNLNTLFHWTLTSPVSIWESTYRPCCERKMDHGSCKSE